MEAAAQPKIGRIRRGWEITKSSWQVLKLDKELASFPIISFFTALAILAPFAIVVGLNSTITDDNITVNLPTGVQIAGVVLLYFLLTFAANYFSGAIIYGAAQRFQGKNPTLRSCFQGVNAKFAPLALFSLMMAIVGLILQALEDRFPIAGQIAVAIFNGAWNIANIFAIPVIVLSEENVSPLGATKRSVGIIKKVWGEGIVVNLGLGLIAVLTVLVYILIWSIVGAVVNATGSGIALAITLGIAVIGFMLIALIFSVLGGIAKAALYLYATTGEAPALFDRNLLEGAVNKKKTAKAI
jgi:membrane-anchored glycerophosphoryl diester phosphodiesterase (GDPDase)